MKKIIAAVVIGLAALTAIGCTAARQSAPASPPKSAQPPASPSTPQVPSAGQFAATLQGDGLTSVSVHTGYHGGTASFVSASTPDSFAQWICVPATAYQVSDEDNGVTELDGWTCATASLTSSDTTGFANLTGATVDQNTGNY